MKAHFTTKCGYDSSDDFYGSGTDFAPSALQLPVQRPQAAAAEGLSRASA